MLQILNAKLPTVLISAYGTEFVSTSKRISCTWYAYCSLSPLWIITRYSKLSRTHTLVYHQQVDVMQQAKLVEPSESVAFDWLSRWLIYPHKPSDPGGKCQSLLRQWLNSVESSSAASSSSSSSGAGAISAASSGSISKRKNHTNPMESSSDESDSDDSVADGESASSNIDHELLCSSVNCLMAEWNLSVVCLRISSPVGLLSTIIYSLCCSSFVFCRIKFYNTLDCTDR